MEKSSLNFNAFILVFLIQLQLICLSYGIVVDVTIGVISSLVTIGTFLFPPKSTDYTGTLYNIEHLTMMNQVQTNEKFLDFKKDIIRIVNKLPGTISYDRIMYNVKDIASDVDATYTALQHNVLRILNNTEVNHVDKDIILNRVRNVFSEIGSAPQPQAQRIYHALTDENGILKYLENFAKDEDFSTCSKENLQSYQQSLGKMLKLFAFSYIKAYLNLRMAADLYLYLEKESPNELNDRVEQVNNYYHKLLEVFQQTLGNASRTVWRCDPDNHEEGKTYIRPSFFQKYIANTYNLIANPKLCHYNHGCQFDGITENNACDFTKYGFDIHASNNVDQKTCALNRKCAGKLHQCKAVHDLIINARFDSNFLICHSVPNSSRRYEGLKVFARLSDHKTDIPVNSIGKCEVPGERLSKESSDMHGYWYCDTCMCTCDDQYDNDHGKNNGHYTHRYIYTGIVEVDILKNLVLTGVRLATRNGVIFPEIQQGILLAEGIIDVTSLSWQTVQDYNLNDPIYLHKITWPNREILLHDVEVTPGHIMTGVQFVEDYFDQDAGEDRPGPIRIAITSRSFDILTGNVDLNSAGWNDIYAAGVPRDTITIENLKLPDSRLESNIIETNKLLRFSTSEIESDLGQTTTPFWDMQEVKTIVPVPMSGAGLYYKHAAGRSGFIGIRLRTYDISQQLKLYKDNIREFGEDVYKKKISVVGNRIGLFSGGNTQNHSSIN